MKLKALIIEDEEDALYLLKNILLEYCYSIEILGSASDLQGSLTLINATNPDIVFCDIQLEDCNAFDILDALGDISFNLIFTTAYDEYALKAFKYNAIHYVLKPYTPKEVLEAVERIKESQTDSTLIKRLAQELNRNKSNRIGIASFGQIKMVDIHDIICVEADRAYSRIYTIRDKPLITSKPLKEFNDILPQHSFLRVHSSYLVNINHISEFNKADGGTLILSDGTNVPVSRRRKKDIIEILLNN